MIKFIFNLLVFLLSNIVLGQVVTTTPEFPTENDSIVVYFNSAEGDKGLIDYVGEIFAHTGVITDASNGEWTNVIAEWSISSPQTKLTKITENQYKLNIGKPKDYYSVNASDKILKLAFVFKNSDQSKTGRDDGGSDIFINLFEEGLNVKITQPDNKLTFVEIGDQLNVAATSSISDSLKLFLDNTLLAQTDSNEISFSLDIIGNGKKWLIATANKGLSVISDSTLIFVRSEPIVKELPAGNIEGINYNDQNNVILNLFAPDKEFVYVIGDFNNWEVDTNFLMHKDLNDSTFWLNITGLAPKEEYGFQYLVDGELRIADPYTEKTLDPNDKFISENTFPNLLEYPTNKTTKIISIIQTAQDDYTWSNDSFAKPEKTDLVIYEMWLRNFIEDHTYQTLIDTLDYLENLGINAIELMPINEFEGNDSWGYNPSFYFAVDKNYGPAEDLKKFIDECHSRGIAVIIDMVLNHSYGQNPMVQLYFDKYADNQIYSLPNSPWFNVKSFNDAYKWGADFNHESPYTKKFIDRVNKYWLTEFNVDGFRFDFTKGFTNKPGDGWAYDQSRISNLKRMSDQIWNVDSTAYVILEHLADNNEEKALANYGIMLWGNMNHNYNEATMGFNESNKSDFSYGFYKSRGWSGPNLVTYMESHDEERLMYKNLKYGNSSGSYTIKDLNVALNRIKLASAFFFTIPGPKMIWQFGELGFDYSINWPNDCRLCLKPFVWDYQEEIVRSNLYKTIQALIKLRLENEVFRTEDVNLSVSTSVKSIKLTHESMNAIIIGNFDVIEKQMIPNFHSEGMWYNYFSGDSINVNAQESVSLLPGEFRIYTTKKLETPEQDILLGLQEIGNSIPENYSLSQNYPNPFNPSTTINFSIPESLSSKSANTIIKIFDVLGNEIKTLVNEELSSGNYEIEFNGSDLSSGIYFYTLSVNEFFQTKKMILLK